jgi:hypothetical protein
MNTEQVYIVVMFLTYIWEGLGSSLGCDTGHPEFFLQFSSLQKMLGKYFGQFLD